ncbi:MAG: SAM-dependent methyltransferase [Magnetococcus sp. DMHC-6]
MSREIGGTISFHRFMELALYHPEYGYYMKPNIRLGRMGDFVTAPEMTSLIGELLALEWIHIWEALGRPEPFTIVEVGAGSGHLAADLLRTSLKYPEFWSGLRYVIVEKSPDFCARQYSLLQQCLPSIEKISWHDHLSAAVGETPIDGVIFGHEFLDAFPVHWVTMTDAGLREKWVKRGKFGFEIEVGFLSNPLLFEYFSKFGLSLERGYCTEVCLEAQTWVVEAAPYLRRGAMVFIDYGWPASEYYAPFRHQGSLTGYYRHTYVQDVLMNPGNVDLTAHVDFSAIARAGQRGGLDVIGFTTQAWFLMGLGLLERVGCCFASGVMDVKTQQLKATVERLLMPHGMGEIFKCLAMGKGLPENCLQGFRLNNRVNRL